MGWPKAMAHKHANETCYPYCWRSYGLMNPAPEKIQSFLDPVIAPGTNGHPEIVHVLGPGTFQTMRADLPMITMASLVTISSGSYPVNLGVKRMSVSRYLMGKRYCSMDLLQNG